MSSLFFGLDEIGSTEKQPDSNYAWGLVKHAESLEFLKTHGAAWSFTFRIGTRTYWRGFFATVEELEEEKSQLLLDIEYKPIRWWQFWRHKETKPSKSVLARFRALAESKEG